MEKRGISPSFSVRNSQFFPFIELAYIFSNFWDCRHWCLFPCQCLEMTAKN